MSDETPDTPDTTEPEPDTTGQEPDTDESDDWTPPDKAEWEKAKARRDKATADRAAMKAERDALAAELRKIKAGDSDGPAEPSEADKLRAGMVRTAGRAVLAGAGITDKKDQAALLDAIKLDGIEVDDDGEVDTEELESRIGELRRILGAGQSGGRRVPRTDTRDKGGRNAEPTDPDAARYARIMGRR